MSVMFPWLFMFLEVLHSFPCIRGSSHLLQSLLTTLCNSFKLVLFLLQQCYRTFPLEIWTSIKALSSVGDFQDPMHDGYNSFQVPGHVLLDPTAPKMALLSVDECQITVVEGGNTNEHCLIQPQSCLFYLNTLLFNVLE